MGEEKKQGTRLEEKRVGVRLRSRLDELEEVQESQWRRTKRSPWQGGYLSDNQGGERGDIPSTLEGENQTHKVGVHY